MSQLLSKDISASNAGQACRECRRRKGKCDAKLPVCSVCKRYNRHCLYDKHSRSALTRKHLTEVEERLERAEALIRALLTNPELSKTLLQENLANPSNEANPDVQPDIARLSKILKEEYDPQTRLHDAQFDNTTLLGATQQNTAQFAANFQAAGLLGTSSILDDGIPSAADDGFEWDEREALWAPYSLGDGQQLTDDTKQATIRNITDGMATLTANDSNTGFLGSVSGAALLRLMSEQQHDIQTPREDSGLMDDQRSSSTNNPAFPPIEKSSSQGSWFRAQPLITQAFVNSLVDLYFAYYHPTFPILHEPTFRQHYQSLNERPKGTWHTLANLVAALGSFVSTDSSDETDVRLFNAVKSQLTIECLEAGSLGLVQAFAMAANYLQKRNKPNSGYNYGGVALRLAISLGLHKEFRSWHAAPLKKEIRRRVWWSLCVLDVGATITYGRPLNWPREGVEAQFPSNINEKDLDISSTSFPPELDDATTYSYVRTQSAYHLATIPIYNRLISSPMPSASELTAMDDKLIEGWRRSLPLFFNDTDLSLSNEYLLGHSISRWRFRIMRIIMYRPFFLKWVKDGLNPLQPSLPNDTATSRCLVAAEECISIISHFWTTATRTRLAAWYVLYFLLQAVLIPVHCLRHVPSHPQAASWIMQVRTALQVAGAMVDINPGALRCRDIIYRLCGPALMDQKLNERQEPLVGAISPDLSNMNSGDPSVVSWMTEIDTAINGYNMYCDHLTNTADAIDLQHTGLAEVQPPYVSGEPYGIPNWDSEEGYRIPDWDLGLMLMQ